MSESHPHPEVPCYYFGTSARLWIPQAGTDRRSRWDEASSTVLRPESKKTSTTGMEMRTPHKKRGGTSYVRHWR